MTAEEATAVAGYFATMMEKEFTTTCRVLAAVPDERRDYRPDEKSRTGWELAVHIATSDVWFLDCVVTGRFAFDKAANDQLIAGFRTVADVVGYYEREYGARLAQLRAMPADRLTAIVDFFGMMQQPAAAYLGMVNNHGIHHRGQLAAYLRAMGSKVPAMYGGSADEPMNAAAGS